MTKPLLMSQSSKIKTPDEQDQSASKQRLIDKIGELHSTYNYRRKAKFFQKYDDDTAEEPTTRRLFQNEYELEKPRTNTFKYRF